MRTPNRDAINLQSNTDDILSIFQHDVHFRTALLLSTPELYDQTVKSASQCSDTEKNRRLQRSLWKYYLRMGYRCTPFGLWAGFCHGIFGEKSNISFSYKRSFQTFSRPDMLLLAHIAEKEEKNLIRKGHLKLFPNNTIYNACDEIRYIEYRTKKGKRHYHIASIKKTSIISSILSFCTEGKTINELTVFLKTCMSEHKSQQIISDLIDNQVLKTSLEPTVTGPYYGQILKQKIQSNASLLKAFDLFPQFDNTSIHTREDVLKDIHKTIKRWYTTTESKFTVQTDTLLLTDKCIIDKRITHKLLSALHALTHLTIKRNNEDLERFKGAFMHRYNGNEMPLALILDAESGIPYPEIQKLGNISPLVEDIITPSKNNSTQYFDSDPASLFLHKKVKEAQISDKCKITLTDKELDELPICDSTPLQMSALIRILSAEKSGKAGKILFEGTGGMGGANLFARMAHTSKEIRKMGQEICDFEASFNKDKIIAEVVHLPEDRIGNILSRPAFYKYEIPYLARSSVDNQHQIPVSDITISIRNNRIILRSERLKREIIPRLTSAHNYHKNTLPVYRFLCDIQNDGVEFPGFGWGGIGTLYDHLPAVWYRDVCFSPQKWIIKDKALKELKNIAKEKNTEKQEHHLHIWRKKMKMPERIISCIFDNEIPLDLSKNYGIDLLLSLGSTNPCLEIKEDLFDTQNPFLNICGKPYTNEINIIFRKDI